jgi:hypothetical protein
LVEAQAQTSMAEAPSTSRFATRIRCLLRNRLLSAGLRSEVTSVDGGIRAGRRLPRNI